MNEKYYDKFCLLTSIFSLIIIIYYIFNNFNLCNQNKLFYILIFSAIFSIIWRSYRYYFILKEISINDNIYAYCDRLLAKICFVITSFSILFNWKISLIFLICTVPMIISEILYHNNNKYDAIYYHSIGHLMICIILIYILLNNINVFKK